MRAAAFLASFGSVDRFDGLRPWRAAFYLISRLLPHGGLSHAHGVDNRLRLHADTEQLTTAFLESPTRAFDLLDSSCEQAMGGLRFFEKVLADAISGSDLQSCSVSFALGSPAILSSSAQSTARGWQSSRLSLIRPSHSETESGLLLPEV